MAFYGRRRRFRRGKRRTRARRFVRKIARVSKRVIRRMSEVKRYLITGSTTVQNTQQLINLIPDSNQGADKDQRIGNKIRFRYLTLKVFAAGTNNQASGTGATAAIGRLALLTSRTQSLTAANAIEEGVSTTPTNTTIAIPLRSENCNVLKDTQFWIAGAGAAGSANDSSIYGIPAVRKFKFSRRLVRNARYASGTDTKPGNSEANVYLYMAGTNNVMSIQYNYSGRISYIDI